MRKQQELVKPTVIPPERLPKQNLVPMIVFGFLFQFLAYGAWSLPIANWLCFLPLFVFVRTQPLVKAVGISFAIIFSARMLALIISGDQQFAEHALVVATLSTLVLCVHRICLRELPKAGPLAAPAAFVALAYLVRIDGSAYFTFDVSDILIDLFENWTPYVSGYFMLFCVIWAQSIMAGFGEIFLVEDPIPQDIREQGLRLSANIYFWGVILFMHISGIFLKNTNVKSVEGILFAYGCTFFALGCFVTALLKTQRRSRDNQPHTNSQTNHAQENPA